MKSAHVSQTSNFLFSAVRYKSIKSIKQSVLYILSSAVNVPQYSVCYRCLKQKRAYENQVEGIRNQSFNMEQTNYTTQMLKVT